MAEGCGHRLSARAPAYHNTLWAGTQRRRFDTQDMALEPCLLLRCGSFLPHMCECKQSIYILSCGNVSSYAHITAPANPMTSRGHSTCLHDTVECGSASAWLCVGDGIPVSGSIVVHDILVSVDGQSVEKMEMPDIQALLRGSPTTHPHVLTVHPLCCCCICNEQRSPSIWRYTLFLY